MIRDPHPWASNLDTLHAQVWTCLIRGVKDRRAPARHPALATVAASGLPRARTVVLRSADRLTGCLDIHTDIHSAKVTELRARPHAALHVWDGAAHLQLRLETEGSRVSYGSQPPPGRPIAAALGYVKSPDPASFAVLRLRVDAVDVVHLGPDHRRARFERQDQWQGQWLAP